MAAVFGRSSEASQLPKSEDAPASTPKASKKFTRRQWTLISIAVCLNVLLWSSIFVFIASLYTIAADPNDSTNIPSEALTIISALASIGYIVTHTVFSLKQRIWRHQGRHPSIHIKTSYIAVRYAVSLCILWLLTTGWNMITVARRPVCLPYGQGLEGWEAGTTCIVARTSISISFIGLIASCCLFVMLAVFSRPFEAHVFKIGYNDNLSHDSTPDSSRQPSLSRSRPRSASVSPDQGRNRFSSSTQRTATSTASNTDVDTLDLNSNPSSTIIAPSPVRAIGLGIFTSHAQPPPIPAAYHMSHGHRSFSLDAAPTFVRPTIGPASAHLPPPPRLSSLIAPSGFMPLSVPVQYSHSAWRAVHPELPSPLGTGRTNPAARRSVSELHHASSTHSLHSFAYRSRFSRSSVSLTRPHRLSTATPVGSIECSSRSGSTGPGEADGGRDTPGSARGRGNAKRSVKKVASASEVAYAILNGTVIPGTVEAEQHSSGGDGEKYQANSMRRASAPDATCGAAHAQLKKASSGERMARGWKPQLSTEALANSKGKAPVRNIVRSSSAEILSKFSLDSSSDDTMVFRRSMDLGGKETVKPKDEAPAQMAINPAVSRVRSEALLLKKEDGEELGLKRVASLVRQFRRSMAGRITAEPKVVKYRNTVGEVSEKGNEHQERDTQGKEKEKKHGEQTERKRKKNKSAADTSPVAPELPPIVIKKRRIPIEEAKNKPLPRIAALEPWAP